MAGRKTIKPDGTPLTSREKHQRSRNKARNQANYRKKMEANQTPGPPTPVMTPHSTGQVFFSPEDKKATIDSLIRSGNVVNKSMDTIKEQGASDKEVVLSYLENQNKRFENVEEERKQLLAEERAIRARLLGAADNRYVLYVFTSVCFYLTADLYLIIFDFVTARHFVLLIFRH